MRAPKVEIGGGDGFDLLVSAVAVADPDWRPTWVSSFSADAVHRLAAG